MFTWCDTTQLTIPSAIRGQVPYQMVIRHIHHSLPACHLCGGGGDGCHLRVVPPGQLHRRLSTPKRFCLSAIFIEPGFFVFAFRWFRVFQRGCYVYFLIVFS